MIKLYESIVEIQAHTWEDLGHQNISNIYQAILKQ